MEPPESKVKKDAEVHFRVSAPGKVILLGEHSVVYGKTALAASIDRRTSMLFSNRSGPSYEDKTFRLQLPMVQVDISVDVQEVRRLLAVPLPAPHTDYNWKTPELINVGSMTSEIREFLNKLPGFPFNHGQECALIAFFFLLRGMFSTVRAQSNGFRMEVTSELDLGAGTGSSASYGVCLAAGLYHLLRCRVAQEGVGRDVSEEGFKFSQIVSPDLTRFSEDETKVILSWALLSDGIMHGNPSGIDATVITHGKVISFRRSEGGKTIDKLPEMNILLVDSGFTRDTKRMVSGVADLRSRYPQIVDLVLDAMDQVALTAKDLFTQPEEQSAVITKLGELMMMNHSFLSSLFVSHPALDDICGIAKRHGLAAKLTGAGGGGYAIVLLQASANVEALVAELKTAGYNAVTTRMGGEGVQLHLLD